MNLPHTIEINCPIHDDYRRDFYLEVDGAKMSISIRGRQMTFNMTGSMSGRASSMSLDWMQECVDSARCEFE